MSYFSPARFYSTWLKNDKSSWVGSTISLSSTTRRRTWIRYGASRFSKPLRPEAILVRMSSEANRELLLAVSGFNWAHIQIIDDLREAPESALIAFKYAVWRVRSKLSGGVQIRCAFNMRYQEPEDKPTQIKMQLRSYLVILVLPVFMSAEALGLSIGSIEVPAAAMNSSQVTLICNYDLQGDQLYSVKWYKNYVEFYRYQPPASGNEMSQTEGVGDAAFSADNPTNSKHDFELDGINLNLSKSNASHVYLRQVSLASEGTYKCEVTADTPSFPTVKSERQMKVYVLPKQKLTIVDNSTPSKVVLGDSSSSTGHLDKSQQGSQMTIGEHNRPLSSSATMKTALIYNLNDTVNLTCTSGPSRPQAKISWLLNELPITPASKWIQQSQELTTSDQLIGSRSTLAFKIQPSQLRQLRNSSVDLQVSNSARFQPLKIRCVAKLNFEFLSETSIQASGGKAVVKKRQQQTLASPAPLPLPYSLQSTSSESPGSSDRGTSGASMYRWPRPPGSRGHSRSRTQQESYTDAWITSPASGNTESTLVTGDSQSLDDRSPIDSSLPSSRRYNSPLHNGLAVWTNRQLRSQADHIDSMLRLIKPNELEAPSIEVRLQQLEEKSRDIVTSESIPGHDLEASTDEVSGDDPKTGSHNEKPQSNSVIKDYELSDIVRFTCQPKFAGRTGFDVYEGGPDIRTKWLINNKEVVANRINAFDGHMFYNTKDLSSKTRSSATYLTSNKTSDTLLAISNESITNSRVADQSANQYNLLIEFTPTLFQLKELNIKCHTLIEQTLIEYDSHFTISVATGIIDQDRIRGIAVGNQNQRNNGRVYINGSNNSKRIEKNKLGSARSSQSCSMTSFPCLTLLLTNCILAFLAQLFVFQHKFR